MRQYRKSDHYQRRGSSRGDPLAVHNGFGGLLDDNITPLTWLGVDNWMARGGSELCTNRTLPSTNIGVSLGNNKVCRCRVIPTLAPPVARVL